MGDVGLSNTGDGVFTRREPHTSHKPMTEYGKNLIAPPDFEPRAKNQAQWEHKVVTIQQTLSGWHSHGVYKVFVEGQENTEIVSGKAGLIQEASIDQVLNYFAKEGWRVTTALMTQKGDTGFQYVMTRRVD